MKHTYSIIAATLWLACAGSAAADTCFADYKAKQDNPLRLHYGVAAINGACTKASAQEQLAQRLQAKNWELLNVVSVFGPDGLAERKDSAGSNFLRF